MTIPDQTGRVTLITGANSGIGLETARALAEAGAAVVMAGRNPAKVDAAVSDVKGTTGNGNVSALEMDVSSLSSVRDAAKQVLEGWDRLDLLINNAGVILSTRQESADGYEMTLATNHLGHFLLTDLLLERLKASAPSRVVNVASTAHQGARSMGFDDLQSEGSYTGMRVYSRSKLANILFTKELAKRLAGTGVTTYAVHPGSVRTGWAREGDASGVMALGVALGRPFFIGPRAGAASTIYAATEPGIEGRSGGYFQRSVFGQYGPVKEARPSAAAQDGDAAGKLWEVSEMLVGANRG